MTLSIIVAMSQNRVIGKNNRLPWHLPEDLKRFKQITMGHPIIMGRKTYESIGKPLPGRENIVLTRSQDFHADAIHVVHSLAEALNPPHPPFSKGGNLIQEKSNLPPLEKGGGGGFKEERFVIGGAELFKLALPQATKIYLTLIEDKFEGDVFFPDIDFQKEFKVIDETETRFSEKNQLPYHFITYQR